MPAEGVRAPPTAADADGSGGPKPGPEPPVVRLVLTAWERQLGRVPLGELERTLWEVPPETVDGWFDAGGGVQEVGMIRTCQRFLVLAVTEGAGPAERLGSRLRELGDWEVSRDALAVRRIFRIAAGLESIAVGEAEVREQVRQAASGVRSRHPRPLLRRLLQESVEAASRAAGSESVSMADLAADWLRAGLPDAPQPRLLVIGAGRVGRRLAERLAPLGPVTVLFHRHPPDASWAARWGIALRPSTELREALSGASAVAAAAKASGRLVAPDDFPPGGGGPRLVVDLGLPRNVDPAVAGLPHVTLVDVAGLPRVRSDDGRLRELEESVERSAEASAAGFARESVEPWVRELRQSAERVRRAELSSAVEFAGPLSEEARAALERLSERLVARLLAGPTAELRALPPGVEHDAVRELLLARFREPDGP